MGLSWSGRSEDPHLHIRCYAAPEHIRYYLPFRVAIPGFKANYPYITHPFAALTQHFFSEELKYQDPARLACLIHAASVRSEPGSNSPIIIRKHFETHCLKQIVPFLNRNDDRESFSFQRAKKTPTWLPVQQAFLLERRVTYANCISRSTDFLNYFFRTISHSNLTRFTARFVLNKAGHHTHISLLGNPFFKLFFKNNFLTQISLALQRVLFRTRRVIIRTSVWLTTRFLNYFWRTISCLFQRALQLVFVSDKAGDSTQIKKPCNVFWKLFPLSDRNNQKHQ